jgi:hypothetical protein
MVLGNDARGGTRRALIGFDVASSVPAGSTITGVQFKLVLDMAAPSDTKARSIELHRLLANWGEGTTGQGTGPSKSGQGSSAPTNGTTATWTHRFFNTIPWTNPGGDFAAAASASTVVGMTPQAYTWASTATLINDVQSWLDDPANNFGWLLLGDESVSSTARRFDTHEASNSVARPALTIAFSAAPVPEPATVPLFALVMFGVAAPSGGGRNDISMRDLAAAVG